MQDLNFNIFNIIIIAGIIQGLIFGFFLLSKKKILLGNFYLAVTVLSLSLNNLQYWISDIGFTLYCPSLKYFYLPFELLIIPSFFLFVNLYLNLSISIRTKWLLILPFICSLIIHLLIFIDSIFSEIVVINSKTRNNYFLFEEYVSFIISSFVILYILKEIRMYKSVHFQNLEDIVAQTRWLEKILVIGLFLCLGWIFIIYLMGNNNILGAKLYYPLWISISFLIYWISYASANNYTILLERTTLRKQINNIAPIKKNRPPVPDNHDIILKFELLIRESYSNPILSIDLVAEKLEISGNYLSQIISKHNIKFNNFVNNYRIENSKKMLSDENFSKYTITSIGLEAGFNSKASFYRVFKTHTGQTPTEYRKNN